MYVEADMIYARIKPEDWLKTVSEKLLKKYKKQTLTTSAITVTEIEIVSRREIGIEFSDKVLKKIEKIKNIEIVELNKEILKKSVKIRKKYGINIFDSIHAATAIHHKKDMISTDHIFDNIEELKRTDPRELI